MSSMSLVDTMILQNKLGLGLTFDEGKVRAYFVASSAEIKVDTHVSPTKQYWRTTGDDVQTVMNAFHSSVSNNVNRTLTSCLRGGYHFALERQTFDCEPSDGIIGQISLSDVPQVIMWGIAPVVSKKRHVYVVGVDTVSDALQIMAMRLESMAEYR